MPEKTGASNPVIVPDVVIGQLSRWMKGDPWDYLSKSAPAWDGLTPIEWVRAGHTWDEVMAKLHRFFEGEISQ